MDQYLSTYSKDFAWPFVKKNSSHTTNKVALFYDDDICVCGAEPGGHMAPRQYTASSSTTENHQWSRLEPMGPLYDPKLYTTKMGPVPESVTMRHDQPNTYLKKLEEKYPYLYNVLKNAPSDDMIRRVNEDRLRTTYQVDYGHIDEHPCGDYDKLLAESEQPADHSRTLLLDGRMRAGAPDQTDQTQRQRGENVLRDRSEPVANNGSGGLAGSREPPATGKPLATNESPNKERNLAVKAMRRNGGGTAKNENGGSDSSGVDSKRGGKKNNADDSDTSNNKPLPAWISEYREVIGQTGLDIVRDKIHQHGGKSPGRIFMERAVMHCRAHS